MHQDPWHTAGNRTALSLATRRSSWRATNTRCWPRPPPRSQQAGIHRRHAAMWPCGDMLMLSCLPFHSLVLMIGPCEDRPSNPHAVGRLPLRAEPSGGAPGSGLGHLVSKRVQADWRLVLGEVAMDIRPGRITQGLQGEVVMVASVARRKLKGKSFAGGGKGWQYNPISTPNLNLSWICPHSHSVPVRHRGAVRTQCICGQLGWADNLPKTS